MYLSCLPAPGDIPMTLPQYVSMGNRLHLNGKRFKGVLGINPKNICTQPSFLEIVGQSENPSRKPFTFEVKTMGSPSIDFPC
jgi:hypothetical protein